MPARTHTPESAGAFSTIAPDFCDAAVFPSSHLKILEAPPQDPEILSMLSAMEAAQAEARQRSKARYWGGRAAVKGSATGFVRIDALIEKTNAVLDCWPYEADVDLTMHRHEFVRKMIAAEGVVSVGEIETGSALLHLDPEKVALAVLHKEESLALGAVHLPARLQS